MSTEAERARWDAICEKRAAAAAREAEKFFWFVKVPALAVLAVIVAIAVLAFIGAGLRIGWGLIG